MRRSLLAIAAIALVGCAHDDADDGSGTISDATLDTGIDTNVSQDTTILSDADTGGDTTSDTGAPADTEPSDGGFGAPCNGNSDCDSGWCVESPEGYICTKECLEECPTGFDCKSVQNSGGDVTFLCQPQVDKLCVSCLEDFNCSGGVCMTIGDQRLCATNCGGTVECPDGFTCLPDATGEHSGDYCQPDGDQCLSCEDSGDTTLARTCNRTWTPPDSTQPSYTCSGIQGCTADGWGECVLPAEQCDGLDNNCDGVIDEPYKTDGKYTALEHCGGCGISCLALAPPNATPSCDVSGVLPSCDYACTDGAVDVNGISDDGCECIPLPGDDLTGDGIDSNCDGIDGDVDRGVFVAKDGSDNNPGTREQPVLTITKGLEVAVAINKRDVYVATGVYSERVVLREGIGVFGGFSSFFSERDPLLFETAIFGGEPNQPDQASVSATQLGAVNQAQPTILNGFSVFGTNAANIQGSNSYAVYLATCGPKVRIEGNAIFGGPAGSGGLGTAGTEGASGPDGTDGIDAKDTGGGATSCFGSDHSNGGFGGQLTCGGQDVSGGNGGTGNCPVFTSGPSTAQTGQNGSGLAPGVGGEAGWHALFCASNPPTTGCAGHSFQCGLCRFPSGGNPHPGDLGLAGDDGQSGNRGLGCNQPDGTVFGGHWRGVGGSDGTNGASGSGGGGGGAGGGVDVVGNQCPNLGSKDIGGSGGGGGAGGCGATGGSGGSAGGGSFGVFVADQLGGPPTVVNNTIQRGAGGAGGAGGFGGVGGTGGAGGAGGVDGTSLEGTLYNITWCSGAGGEGGDGGNGGPGGGGGGGCGGASFGIYAWPTGDPSYTSGNVFVGGAAGGVSGAGGPSIDPAASGTNGQQGTSANVNF